jgi:septal ring factor EnvC (AmiA/AmiB activator)
MTPMSDQHTELHELQAAVRTTTSDADQTRQTIDQLQSRLDQKLAPDEDDPEDLLDVLREAALQLKIDHPELAHLIDRAATTLANAGV